VDAELTPPAAAPLAPLAAGDAGRSRLPVRELVGVALQGLRTRRLRAALSALGIAIGIGAMVAVVGVSASAQANLLAEIDALGTNLLTVVPGSSFLGQNAELPATSVPMVDHMSGVQRAAAVYQLQTAVVLRTPYVPSEQTGGIGVDAASDSLAQVLGVGLEAGHFLDRVSARYPEVVLGSEAASILQIEHIGRHLLVYLDNRWFAVVGVLAPVALDSTLNTVAFISEPVARRLFALAPNPTEIYVRTDQSQVTRVAGLLAATADPQSASSVSISRPTDALKARAAAKGQFTTLLLGLGAVALLVGAIGIANIMVISVLERRGEIGLRRALGARRIHISAQFLAESALLAALGGLAGLLFGAAATWAYAQSRHQPFVVPTWVLVAAPACGLAIGALAGLYPAGKAARLSPSEALRT
jgi:putative ABC transport system permease protein